MATTFVRSSAISHIRNSVAAKGTGFYSDAEIVLALERAFVQMALDFRFNDSFATTAAVAGQIPYTWPARCLEIYSVSYDGKQLIRKSLEWIERQDREWRSADQDIPEYWFQKPTASFGVWPPPNGTETLRIDGLFHPAYPSADGNTYDMPPQYEHLLLDLGAHYLCRKDVNGAGAQFAPAYLASYMDGKKMFLDAAQGNADCVVGDAMRGSGIALVRISTDGLIS